MRAPSSTVPTPARVAVFALSAVAPMLVAVALIPVRADARNATVALVLALTVALLAAVGTRATAVVAAISAGVGFDVFHTHPYGSLAIAHAIDLETTALLVAVGLVAGQLAVRNRHHAGRAAEMSYDLGRVHAVAEMVAEGAAVDQVILAVANELRDLLGLAACRFDTAFADSPAPYVERHGAVTWGALRWGFDTLGLPDAETTLVVQCQGRPLGRFVLTPGVGARVTADHLVAAVALADQAGAAIAAHGSPGRVA